MKINKEKQPQEKRLPIYKVGAKRLLVMAFWVLFALGFLFAVYKNFTAVDTHTIHETTVVEEKIVGTQSIENFVINFAKVYYSWEKTAASIEERKEGLGCYMTSALQALNADTVRMDVPVSSGVVGVQIWALTQAGESLFDVSYTVNQRITGEDGQKTVTSIYEVTVYVDTAGDMVIVKNPTITNKPVKSGYEPKPKEPDGTVDAATGNEISEFLTTFFKLYPTATAKEISYYADDGIFQAIGRDYLFTELVNPVYTQEGSQVMASLAVKYLDDLTKTTQISQFDLVLEKQGANWKIVG